MPLRCLRVIIASAFVAVSAQSTVAQDELEALGSGIAWRVSARTPSGTIAGLILSEDGIPIEGAQLTLSGTSVGVLTGEDGAFVLKPPFAGDWELRIEIIGYRYLRDTISVPADHGVYLTALLQPFRSHGLCGSSVCVGTDCRDLNIQVLDSITGLPPEAPVEVRLQHATGTLVNRVQLRPGTPPHGHVGIGRPVDTEGAHSIQVTAPGYRPWRVDTVH